MRKATVMTVSELRRACERASGEGYSDQFSVSKVSRSRVHLTWKDEGLESRATAVLPSYPNLKAPMDPWVVLLAMREFGDPNNDFGWFFEQAGKLQAREDIKRMREVDPRTGEPLDYENTPEGSNDASSN